MNSKQFRAARDRLALDNYGIANLLGLTDRQMRRYAEGATDVSPIAARFINLIIGLELKPDDVVAAIHKGATSL